MGSFNLLAWCEANLEGRQDGDEFPSRCPFCDRLGKFSINHEKQRFRCYRDTCKKGHAARVIAKVEGITLSDAFAKFGSLEPAIVVPAHEKRKRFEAPELFDLELPDEFIPCFDESRDPQYRVIKYLSERLKNETIREFGLGFCKGGTFYNRVIIPVHCPHGRAFLGRDATDEWTHNESRPKYRNASGKWASQMLYGWPQYERLLADGRRVDLAIVEGPFDVMRLWQHGIPAMALFGKELLAGQVSLLHKLSAGTRIILMIDPEESPFVISNIAAQLYARFKIYVARAIMRDDKLIDPGDSLRSEAYQSIDNPERWS